MHEWETPLRISAFDSLSTKGRYEVWGRSRSKTQGPNRRPANIWGPLTPGPNTAQRCGHALLSPLLTCKVFVSWKYRAWDGTWRERRKRMQWPKSVRGGSPGLAWLSGRLLFWLSHGHVLLFLVFSSPWAPLCLRSWITPAPAKYYSHTHVLRTPYTRMLVLLLLITLWGRTYYCSHRAERKLKHREVEFSFSQGNTAKKWQNWNWNPDGAVPESMFSAPTWSWLPRLPPPPPKSQPWPGASHQPLHFTLHCLLGCIFFIFLRK